MAGRLSFTYGIMGSGKTTLAIQTIYNLREGSHSSVLVVKPGVDTKAGDKISSRHMGEMPVDVVLGKQERLVDRIDVTKYKFIVVDEAQFLSIRQVLELKIISQECNIGIVTFGLLSNFRGEIFEGSGALMSLADDRTQLRVVCRECGEPAQFNARMLGNEFVYEGGVVAIDGAKANNSGEEAPTYSYVPLCARDYIKNVLIPNDEGVQYVVSRLKTDNQ